MNSILSKTLLVCCFALSAHAPALGADWGYEDGFANEKKDQFERGTQPVQDPSAGIGMPAEELEATPNSLGGDGLPQQKVPSKRKPFANSPGDGVGMDTPLGAVENENEIEEQIPGNPVVNHWLSLLGLCAQLNPGVKLPEGPDFVKQLSENQKQRFSVVLNKMLAGKEKAELVSIEKFWRSLNRMLQDEQQRSNYRLLFRALLSMRADSNEVSADERTMIFETLGPKRIAEPGPPPLTEDALNAYSDMACFLYERSHKGKTVDAEDNRQLYTVIVKDRFFGAPTDRDRQAMNDFPLSWAKFRILYNDATEGEKMLLAERIASKEGTRGLNIRNPMLEEVLSSPAWKRFILAQAKNAAGAPAKATATAGGAAKKPAPVKKKSPAAHR